MEKYYDIFNFYAICQSKINSVIVFTWCIKPIESIRELKAKPKQQYTWTILSKGQVGEI